MDAWQPLRDELRALETHLEGAQRRLSENDGGLGLDIVKGTAEVVVSIASGGPTSDSFFPSTEDASHEVMDAFKAAHDAWRIATNLSQQGAAVPAELGPTLGSITAALDKFPVNTSMSHSSFGKWANTIAELRGSLAPIRLKLG